MEPAAAVDPRWQRVAGAEREASSPQSRSRNGSFNARSPGANPQEPAPSIVFSANWVSITNPIGEGAFSRVYEGLYTNPETHEQSVVAVKILKKNMLKRRADCLRFIKEAKITTKISQKNIVACYGIGKYDDNDPVNPGSLFIVQELVRGGNLLHKVYKQMLNRSNVVYTSHEALSWMLDVAQGMQYLHEVVDEKPMIIHRDLKLENIMLAPAHGGGTFAKLVDFGLHKVVDERTKKVIKRVVSEASIGLFPRIRGAKEGGEDEDDELEEEMAKQAARQAAMNGGGGDAALLTSAAALLSAATAARPSPLRKTSMVLLDPPSMVSHKEEEEEEGEVADGHVASGSMSPTYTAAPKSPLSRGTTASSGTDSAGGEEGVRSHHGPVKRESSMQRLMAKMKEIKLRVIGGTPTPNRDSSQPTSPKSPLSSPGAAGNLLPALGSERAAAGTPRQAATAADRRLIAPEHLPTLPPPSAPVDSAKLARNEALLNRLLAQQSVARSAESQAVDDSSLPDSTGRPSGRKPAPRRAVTWVNEVRYNLTEAVGSWAYMAPEVVLGQPYNEKVDVFSFGVILFEVLNRKLMLVDEIKNDPRKDAQMYAERVARGFRPEIPRRWPYKLRALISSCWAQDAHLRPNFVAIVDMLLELQRTNLVGSLDAQTASGGSAYI